MVICLSSLDTCTPPVTLDSLFTAMKYIWFAAVWLIILNLPRSQATNCFDLKERCRMSEDECAGLWNTTEQVCGLSGVNCQLKNVMPCNVTILYFTDRYPDFKACTCPNDIYCTIKRLLGMNYSSQETINLEWETSLLKNMDFAGPKSCLDVATLCIGDTVCNRHLAALMKACSVNETRCNVENCTRTIRAFYETMPFNMSQMLAFCYCDQSHETCLRARDALHIKSCTAHSEVPISCLQVIPSCLQSELCRERYRIYQAKCWEPVSSCLNNGSCLLGFHKEDLTCSESDECRAAYIRTLGTKLQMPCNCSNGHKYEEQHLCELYSHILHSKSCLKKFTARNIHASYSDSQGEQIKSKGPARTFQTDAVIYIIAYTSGIILISGIILLTLLQTRVVKKTYIDLEECCHSIGGAAEIHTTSTMVVGIKHKGFPNRAMQAVTCGFCTLHSTENTFTKVSNDLQTAKSNGDYSLLVLLDFFVGFDTVDHQLLLRMLHPIGLKGLVDHSKKLLSHGEMFLKA
ncbi:GDNF family receptor alpha-like [Eleutherodactylus coqui]|uniref:GDNF family receptor alpha-like n=1 Tax=Eleutherodactylus coqui TaxID=57060 RepID=UPI003462F2E0